MKQLLLGAFDALDGVKHDDHEVGNARRGKGALALLLANLADRVRAGSIDYGKKAGVRLLVDAGGAGDGADLGAVFAVADELVVEGGLANIGRADDGDAVLLPKSLPELEQAIKDLGYGLYQAVVTATVNGKPYIEKLNFTAYQQETNINVVMSGVILATPTPTSTTKPTSGGGGLFGLPGFEVVLALAALSGTALYLKKR